MTIVAGFLHRDGVLICADTQQESWVMKMHAPKVGHFDCYGGKVAYAFSGHSAFAESAIQKCERKLKSTNSGDLQVILERLLDREYRRVVFGTQLMPRTLRFTIGFYSPLDLLRVRSSYTQPSKLLFER
jgi:hypothetical protein